MFFEKRRRSFGWLLAGLSLVSACTSYEPKPLSPVTIDREFMEREARDLAPVFASPCENPGHSGHVYDVSDGLSLCEAERVLLVLNRPLRRARLDASAALAAAENAGLWNDPVFSADLERILASSGNPWLGGGSLGLVLPLSGRKTHEVLVANADHAVSLQELVLRELELRRELWRLWSMAAHAAAESELASAAIHDLSQLVPIADRLEAAGEIPRTESRLLRIQEAAWRADYASAVAAREEVERRIRQHIGLPPGEATALQTAWFESNIASSGAPRAEDLSRHPKVQVMESRYQRSERRLAAAVAGQYPDLHIGPGGGAEDGDGRVRLGISFPIPLWNGNAQAIALASVEREATREDYVAERELLLHDRHATDVHLNTYRESMRLIESTLIVPLEEQCREVDRLFSLGSVNFVLWLESTSRLYDARRRLLRERLHVSFAEADRHFLSPPPEEIPGAHPEVPDAH